jgi:hypothetical protein
MSTMTATNSERGRATRAPDIQHFNRALAALACGAAGAIHFMAAPDHATELGWWFGVSFVIVGTWQIVSAFVLAVRPKLSNLLLVGSTTLLVLGAYAFAHTRGLPVGPNPWQPEDTETLGTASLVAEGLLLAALLWPALAAQVSAGRALPMALAALFIGGLVVVQWQHTLLAPVAVVPPPQGPHKPGQTAEAQRAFQELLGELDDPWQNDIGKAVVMLENYENVYPGNADAEDKLYSARIELAKTLEADGSTLEAAVQYKLALDLLPDRVEAKLALQSLADRYDGLVANTPANGTDSP